ncbi:hypothetical protein VNO78_30950 [Psophocarpus tetragonolobus]|uniref:Uncharacterized protein n=1 Tax=Psophocarpus tetragonolobus TaxID=3891 RepID=A0AAN9RXT4_PSOTE
MVKQGWDIYTLTWCHRPRGDRGLLQPSRQCLLRWQGATEIFYNRPNVIIIAIDSLQTPHRVFEIGEGLDLNSCMERQWSTGKGLTYDGDDLLDKVTGIRMFILPKSIWFLNWIPWTRALLIRFSFDDFKEETDNIFRDNWKRNVRSHLRGSRIVRLPVIQASVTKLRLLPVLGMLTLLLTEVDFLKCLGKLFALINALDINTFVVDFFRFRVRTR